MTLTTLETKLLRKKSTQHKYDHGHTLVLTGPAYKTGAARLSARAALRVGAGLVTLGAPRDALPECAAQSTAIMLSEVSEPMDLALLVAEDKRINALCLGPSLGLDRANIVEMALSLERPMVLDADALTILATKPELTNALNGNCVLTPHAGEFKRLFPGFGADSEMSADEKIDITARAADMMGVTLLYKGGQTVVAAPGKTPVSLDSQKEPTAAWLATAGSGDVLAGLIAGLMARGIAPFDAAVLGTKLHVLAAKICGSGLIAEDLPEALPHVLRDIGV